MPVDRSDITIIDKDVDHSFFAIKSNSASNLRKIKILGTGGTIASKGSHSSQTAGYKVDLTIDELIGSIPDISSSIELVYEQVMNLDSKEMDSEHLICLYKSITECLQDPSIDGIVITHGTDTMEETSFFLEMCLDTDTPIVLSGSMRPSTSISADGPMNLYQLICIAADERSRKRGILVSLNDQISSGYYITKANANTLDTFNGKQGYLGNFVNNEIHYYYPPVKPMASLQNFQLDLSKPLEEVTVLYTHQGFNTKMFRLLLDGLNAKGLVIATMGAGSLSQPAIDELSAISEEYNGLPIILSKRTMDGMVPRLNVTLKGCIAGGYLNPQKLRILLQLCLNSGRSVEEIKGIFSHAYGG